MRGDHWNLPDTGGPRAANENNRVLSYMHVPQLAVGENSVRLTSVEVVSWTFCRQNSHILGRIPYRMCNAPEAGFRLFQSSVGNTYLIVASFT